MLEFVGTIAGNVLSLPGVLGFGMGLLTRRLGLAAVLGGLVGVFEAMIFAGLDISHLGTLEFVMSVLVGVIAGTLGCAVRRKGATV